MMARNSRREKIAITPRRSVALYALLSKVIVSYILVIVLAAGCVYLPYLCCKAWNIPSCSSPSCSLGAFSSLGPIAPRHQRPQDTGGGDPHFPKYWTCW